jgi:23S rRNA (guanosine2251-2'-O)-methyltransferase
VATKKPFRTGLSQTKNGRRDDPEYRRNTGSPIKPETPVQTPRAKQSRRLFTARHATDVAILYGYHTVREALASPHRTLLTVYATPAAAQRLSPLIAARGLTPLIISAEQISAKLPKDAVHQGVMVQARHLESLDISELPATGTVIVLDQITDPHNVGAIIRTAAAFGVEAIVTAERHSPELAGVLAKSASGGLEHVRLVIVTNLARALSELGDMGYLRIGLDSQADGNLVETPLSPPVALVFGAEGKGLRHLTREKCDVLARLDMAGPIKSLNVSNACAVALTIISMRLKAEVPS